jgi:hypothetical protein
MHIKRIPIAIGALAGSLVLVAQPADASSQLTLSSAGVQRTTVVFKSNTDNILVTDDEPDGWGGRSVWHRGQRSGECNNSTGAETTTVCNYDFAEDVAISYNACAKDNDVSLFCTPFYDDVT